MPANTEFTSWFDPSSAPTSASTLKAANGFHFPMNTPGMAIGLATPGPLPTHPALSALTTVSSTRASLDQSQGHARTPSEKLNGDYFNSQPTTSTAIPTAMTPGGTATTNSTEATSDQVPTSPDESRVPGTPGQEKGGMFGKKMWKNFGMKSLKKTQTQDKDKPSPVEEKFEDSDSRSSKTEDKVIEDNLQGAIQRIRLEYDAQMQKFERERNDRKEDASELSLPKLETLITPSLPNDTPVLKPPGNVTILIQEDRVDSGGVADLFEGTVSSSGIQTDRIEKVMPMWVADVLLKVSTHRQFSVVVMPLTEIAESYSAQGNRQGLLHP